MQRSEVRDLKVVVSALCDYLLRSEPALSGRAPCHGGAHMVPAGERGSPGGRRGGSGKRMRQRAHGASGRARCRSRAHAVPAGERRGTTGAAERVLRDRQASVAGPLKRAAHVLRPPRWHCHIAWRPRRMGNGPTVNNLTSSGVYFPCLQICGPDWHRPTS